MRSHPRRHLQRRWQTLRKSSVSVADFVFDFECRTTLIRRRNPGHLRGKFGPSDNNFLFLCNNQQMSQCAVKFYFSASPLYMFRAAHTPIIRSTTLTVSTAIGTIHSRSQTVSVTSSQRSLARSARLRWEEVTETIRDRLWIVPMAVDTVKIVLLMMGVCAARNM